MNGAQSGKTLSLFKSFSLVERVYLHEWYMNPGRFYPKYLLAKLYEETGQREKAVIMAIEVLQMHIKAPSKAIDEIKEKMQNIIEQYNGID